MIDESAAPAMDPLEQHLRSLGGALVLPTPNEHMVARVMSRLQQEPDPSPWWRIVVAVRTAGRWLRERWQITVAVLVGSLILLVAVTPAGAKVREWLGFGAVVVVLEQAPPAPVATTPATGPAASTGSNPPTADPIVMSVQQARAAVPFPVGVPDGLGGPELVTVSADLRAVSMTWPEPGGQGLRLDQIAGSPDPYFVKKYYDDIEFTAVDGREALWLAVPHPIVVQRPGEPERVDAARMSGPALVWQREGVTLRLEGVDDRSRAVAIAESVQ